MTTLFDFGRLQDHQYLHTTVWTNSEL